MSQNLSRVTGKIFAGNASEQVVGQFGSALAGTKVNTTDIATIQGLSAYTNGWSSAVLTDRNYPTLEEMNGVMRVMSYQTAYTLQKGMPEWDSSTTYFLGDMCKGVGEGKIYTSKVNNNIGNPVTDTVFWQEFEAGSGSVNLQVTNYMSHLDGTPSYNGLTVSMPATTYYIPNGRSGDNTLNNTIQNVQASTYTVSGDDGTYTLFYNNNTSALHLAPNYTSRAANYPTSAIFNDVTYLLNNKMYVQETIAPNYSISDGVQVSSAGIVSALGTLSFNNAAALSSSPVFNLKFTTGSDITTAQSLFTLPYAIGTIENGNLNVAISSYSYGVNYNTQLYSGAYTLINQTTEYAYTFNNSIYHTDGAIAVGSSLYTDGEMAELYGTVSVLTDAFVTVVNSESIELYSGSYEDVSTTTYSYTIGAQNIYSSTTLTTGLIIYSDSDLLTIYGVVESVTSSNIVIHSIDTSLGYVDTNGSGRVTSGISIYSDVDLQTFIQTSTGLNANYNGSTFKSLVSNLTFNITTDTTYEGNLINADNAYTLTLNNTATSAVSSRVPYTDSSTLVLGGSGNFNGTFDLSGTSITDVWNWNGKNISTLDWQEEPLCKIGSITMSEGIISALEVDYPIELVKMSDIESVRNIISIGQPQFTLDFSNLPDGCIWLEGAEISRTTYAALFAVYGTTYGEGDGATTFNLPDCRNRVVWGGDSAGYIEAGLPNITGYVRNVNFGSVSSSGALYTSNTYTTGPHRSGSENHWSTINIDASLINEIYGASSTVQPPAIKVRVYTRYK